MTISGRFMARETVIAETPAILATSASVMSRVPADKSRDRRNEQRARGELWRAQRDGIPGPARQALAP